MTWRDLNGVIAMLTEEQVNALLMDELAGAKRAMVIQRLHRRLCTLRTSRERIELMSQAVRP